MENDERDLLIRVDTTVQNMHRELLGGEGQTGRIPKIEDTQEEHAKQIHTFRGSISAVVWILGIVALLAVTLAGVVAAHVLGAR